MPHPQTLHEGFDQFQIQANNTQHVAAHRSRVAKRTQHVPPNNVAVCCVEMLRSFGRGFTFESLRSKALVKRSQHIPTFSCSGQTSLNIVGRNKLRAFGFPVGTCCDMLGIEKRSSAHACVQHCCTNLAKRQHYATSTIVI